MYGIVKCSKSEVIWLDTNIELSSFWIKSWKISNISLLATGSSPDVGSSKIKSFGWCDKATLDDIMLIYIKGEKSDENY